MKKIVISCGPIPARLDSVKFITNRFKGGLAFKTADMLSKDYDVTVVKWVHTSLPEKYKDTWGPGYNVKIVDVLDVVDYCRWYENNAKNYDAFIMAAAVANLMPSDPYEGKFPSHKYEVGDKFDIKFEIAPRAIDIIKKVNPRCSLIGYKLFDGTEEELIDAAKHTMADSKANIIFANHPATAKTEKLALMPDGTVLRCTFNEHVDLIKKQIDSKYFETVIEPFDDDLKNDINVRRALATVKMFEKTFSHFGTVAVPIREHGDGTIMFATTSRGHKGEPVIVRRVTLNGKIYATGKATLNAPALAACVKDCDHIVVHRHFDDPLFNKDIKNSGTTPYVFPGTFEEMYAVVDKMNEQRGKGNNPPRVIVTGHGDITLRTVGEPDWTKYHEQFPEKYFRTPKIMEDFIRQYNDDNSLEIGANDTSDAAYVYDEFVTCPGKKNLTKEEVLKRHFSLVYVRNAINYLDFDFLKELQKHCDIFIANTFCKAPEEKICEDEASVSDNEYVYHVLRLPDDSIVCHRFHNYDRCHYEMLNFTMTMTSSTGCIVYNNNKEELDFEPD